MVNVVVAYLRDLIDEYSNHLESNIFLFDLISDNLHRLFNTIGISCRGNFFKNISERSEGFLTLNAHRGVKSSHLEDRWEHRRQVLGKL